LETDRDRRIMFKMGPVLSRDNDQRVSGAELECNTRYRDLFYVRIGAGCRYSHRNRPRGLLQTPKEVKGLGIPACPTETLGGLEDESQDCDRTTF